VSLLLPASGPNSVECCEREICQPALHDAGIKPGNVEQDLDAIRDDGARRQRFKA
jgi:hypothetical protein